MKKLININDVSVEELTEWNGETSGYFVWYGDRHSVAVYLRDNGEWEINWPSNGVREVSFANEFKKALDVAIRIAEVKGDLKKL